MKMTLPIEGRRLHPKMKTTTPKKNNTTCPQNEDDFTQKMKTTSPKNEDDFTPPMKTASQNEDGLSITTHSKCYLQTYYNLEICKRCQIENGIEHKVCGIMYAPSNDDISVS